MLNGIDVSEHQNIINWSQAKDDVDFVMIRAGYGRNNIDKSFLHNINECNRLGIPCGIYWFSYALTVEDAKKEAHYCLESIKPYKVKYPVCFDFEYDSVNYATKKGVKMTKALASAIANAFLNAIEDAGYYAVNYTNVDFLNRFFDDYTGKRWDTWLADWKNPNTGKPSRQCGIWQWGGRMISGINGNVDANIAYKDYAKLILDWGLNHLAKTSPVKPKEPVISELDLALQKIVNAGGETIITNIANLIK